MSANKRLGLIGLGQFGRYAVPYLAPRFDLLVHDTADIEASARQLGVRSVTLEEAASCEVVVLAVPIQALRATLGEIAGSVRDGALVVDVCSVKGAPLQWMREALPENVEIIGTHPMFGPNSAGDSLEGQQIVVCPERTTRLDQVQTFLEGLGLRVIVTDADRHDRECAHTQALAQYLGRALRRVEGRELDIRTPAAIYLREVERIVEADSWELFAAIETINPYAAEMRRAIRKRLDELDERLADEPTSR
ncbi:MAG TPA: prephenate dehydrogenase [Acidobacteriota bacterium]|nr:prephenate dehydrogenase [Acidobacteriota bacterium]